MSRASAAAPAELFSPEEKENLLRSYSGALPSEGNRIEVKRRIKKEEKNKERIILRIIPKKVALENKGD